MTQAVHRPPGGAGGPDDGAPAPTWHSGAPLVRGSPLGLALAASRNVRRGTLPDPFCADVGRCLLAAELEFGSWVLRRVERITFEDDRNVHREMSVELEVREDAPVFVDDDGDRYRAVPVMMMRRRTLVDFHMSDEDGRPVSLPGLRVVQQLDQSLLLAAAATVPLDGERTMADDEGVQEFVQRLVAGTAREVRETWDGYAELEPGGLDPLCVLRRSQLFHSVARLLRNNFSLYVFLPERAGRRRMLRLRFVEPIRWTYQQPYLAAVEDEPGTWRYRAGQAEKTWRTRLSHLWAALGWTSTRIRFQVPSAERAASYHVEFVAPPGVRIAQATLLAGRPNEAPSDVERAGSGVTRDHEESSTLTVGLHGVEVPSGSLCRAQLDLRVQAAGWLAVMVSTSAAITAVLLAVAVHYLGTPRLEDAQLAQDTNAVVLLVTTAAAAAAIVAHREFGGVAARLLVGVRLVAAVCTALPVVAAGFVTFNDPDRRVLLEITTGQALSALTAAAVVLTALLAVVYWLSLRVEQAGRRRSPWNMTPERPTASGWWRPGTPDGAADDAVLSFQEEVRRHSFDRPAIGIPSSDAWHEWYDFTDSGHVAALALLGQVQRAVPPGRDPVTAGCPRRVSGCCCVAAPPAPTSR